MNRKRERSHERSGGRRPFELMPDWMESVGHGCPGATPGLIQLCRDICGGFISRFAHFQNVFRPELHNYPEPGISRDSGEIEPAQDWHEQVLGLAGRTDKACYPDVNKSIMELELENFSKQVIASLNTALRKSPNVQ